MSRVVLVTDPMAEEGLALLRAESELEVRVETGLDPEALKKAVAGADALLVRSGTKVTAEVIEAGTRLKVVGRAGTGVDNIDLDAATRRGVVVMNTPGGNSVAACELTFALLLAVMREVPSAARELAAGEWTRKRHMGHQLEGKTLGLIGFGRIGREVAVRARAFGMTVIVNDPFVSAALAAECHVRLEERDTLLAEADVISLHVPFSPETHHLIDEAALARMKPGAVLVNCARGGLVDEAALLASLEAGHVGGAALDVYESEPPGESPLVRHPRVVATPHLGASTEEAQKNVAAQMAAQVVDYLLRGEVRNAVNMPSLSAAEYAKARPALDLAERLGTLGGQLAGAPFTGIDVRFLGAAKDLPRAPVVTGALVGLLRSMPGGTVANYVNARVIAADHGVTVRDLAEDTAEKTLLLEVAVTGTEGTCTVAGTLDAAGAPRLARWEGMRVDAPPRGSVLALRNPDVPGVVGVIGTLLGDAGINIAHIAWGRDRDHGEAFTLINLDAPVAPELLETLRSHPQVLWARAVELP